MAQPLERIRKFAARHGGALTRGVADLARAPRRRARRRKALRAFSLMPEMAPPRRSADDWKRLRKRTLQEARHSLEAGQPNPAIRLLSRALLEDPHHHPYRDQLLRAVAQKRQGRGGAEHRLGWDGASAELRDAVIQLEAFVAYAHEVAALIPKAGIKPWAPGQPRKTAHQPR